MRLFPFIFFLTVVFLASAPAEERLPAIIANTEADRLPGIDLAEGVTQLTGVAISPLLGVSAVGAWQYYNAPEAQRARLPWFCHPVVWGGGFCIIGLCFIKDLFGTVAPPLVKKPLDVAELFESKLSALVACSAFVPFVVSQMARYTPAQASFAFSPDIQFAAVFPAGSFDTRFILVPVAIVGFLVVWVACHAINVLIALCPFGFIDGILKLFKALLLSAVVASSFISPWLGAAVSFGILFVAGLIAPWAFRLAGFGTLFGLDVLLPGRGRRLVRATEPHSFLARPVADAPVRTYGRLSRAEDGSVIFTYRPWLIFPERSVTIPSGNVTIAKGILFPSLLHSLDDQERQRIVVMFLPRYRSHEQSIASHFDIVDIRDSPLIKGFRAIRAWLAEIVSLGKSNYAEFRNATKDSRIP